MNNCSFLGVVSNCFFSEENGVAVVKFELEIEEFRRSSSGEKKRNLTYVELEAWDSAAIAINKYAQEGSLMAVESVARNDDSLQLDGCGEEPLITYFRVTSFKIIH
jgi:single-stranded DNA-binding protein